MYWLPSRLPRPIPPLHRALSHRAQGTSGAAQPLFSRRGLPPPRARPPPARASAAAASPTAMGSKMRLIDIGANMIDTMYMGEYHGKKYHEPDLDQVLARAWGACVDKVIITAGSLEEGEAALVMASTSERLYSTVGVHPTRCGLFGESGDPAAYLAALGELAARGKEAGKVVAVGECGLDYDRLQFCDKDTQKEYFAKQFDIAEATKLPMFLHCRAAAADFLKIMETQRGRWSAGVVHSFDGTEEELESILAMEGLYIGINGCSLKTEENLAVMAKVPLDRLMLETDAPWCDIRNTHAGKPHVKTTWQAKDKKKHEPDDGMMCKGRNEPCTMVQVLEVVAGHRGLRAEAVAEQVYENTRKVFFPDCPP